MLARETPFLVDCAELSLTKWSKLTVYEQLFMERPSGAVVNEAGPSKEKFMKLNIIALSAAALIASAPVAFAQGSSSNAPGQEMQQKGSKKGSPGASGYAPGHEMQNKGSKKGMTGASGYAPGHATTGSSTKDTDQTTRRH